jgi:hypothetical protein
MISLPIRSNLSVLEAFIRELRQSPGQDLRLPVQVTRGGPFGFSAVAVQAVATWARLHEGTRQLQLTPSFADDESTRERVAGSLLGMSGLYFAHQIKAGNTMLARSKALEPVASRVIAMGEFRYRDTLRGRSALSCCFQGAKLEFVRTLYAAPHRGSAEDSSVRSIAQFKDILAAMLDACSTDSSRKLSGMQLEVLASLVHQLFKNADAHTVTDAKGNLYDAGMRGVQVREVVISDEDALENFVADDRALRTYVAKLGKRSLVREKGPSGQLVKLSEWESSSFIEITVFDTGPGLALRWLSRSGGITSYAGMSRDEELAAIVDCFQLHTTTHSTALRGDGLAIALQAMKELTAFMFLRTGRLALYQDFSSKDHTGFKPQARYGAKGLMGEVVGATYSICFPLPR